MVLSLAIAGTDSAINGEVYLFDIAISQTKD